MASNEIELTFIRCPSCKSLMPSTAHKCGMCGLNMDAEEEVQPERKLRLRQRSMTNLGELFEENNNVSASLPTESPIQFDPKDLSLAEKAVVNNVSRPPLITTVRNEYEDELDEDAEYMEENGIDDSEDDNNGTDNIQSSDSSIEEPLRRKRRRRRKKKKPVLQIPSEEKFDDTGIEVSNMNTLDDDKIRSLDVDTNVPIDEIETFDTEKTTYQSLSSVGASIEKSDVQSYKEEPTVEFTKIQEENTVSNKIERNEVMNSNNKLLGWFVNYSTELSGKSYEIREGKKFIGRQQLRQHDLLIPDSAISTPHCLLNAEQGKLSLQDLMSEQGTFLKQVGDGEFKKIESTIQLKHGDILKLGSFELIVCLIPV